MAIQVLSCADCISAYAIGLSSKMQGDGNHSQNIKVTRIANEEFLLDDTTSYSRYAPNNQHLPKKFRLMNPLELCNEKSCNVDATTILDAIKTSGNVVFAASGVFSEKQYQSAIEYLQNRYGQKVEVTVIDARGEPHWLADGKPISRIDPPDRRFNLKELASIERDFVKTYPNGVTIPARKKDDNNPEPRKFKKIQTEETLVGSMGNGYIRLPMADHTAPDADTLKRLYNIIESQISSAQGENKAAHVIWIHCRGGKGRSSSLSLVAHLFARNLFRSQKRIIPRVDFETLARHILLTGGKDLNKNPKPQKPHFEESRRRKERLKEIVQAA